MDSHRDADAVSESDVDPELVSIVMPARDTAPYIEAAIRSIQEQTRRDWELVVVDDGSTDETPRIVERMAAADSRIRLLRTMKSSGPGPARNAGVEQARGRWLAFLDSDDLWSPDKLERQLSFMRAREAALSTHGYVIASRDLVPTGHPVSVPEVIRYRELLCNTIILTTTVMVDRTRVGGLELPPLPQHEDLVLWFSILRRGWIFHGMPGQLATYRLRPRSASRNKLRSVKRMWRIYRRTEGLSRPDAASCFAQYVLRALWKYRGARA